MSIRKIMLVVAVSAAAVPAAFADSGATWVGGEAGFQTHALQGGKTREQVRQELNAFLSNGGATGQGELGYVAPHQHTYLVQNGRQVHADNVAAMGNLRGPDRFEGLDPYLNGGPN